MIKNIQKNNSYINGGKIYFLIGLFAVLLFINLCGCSNNKNGNQDDIASANDGNKIIEIDFENINQESKLEIKYATEFDVDCYEQGIRLIKIKDDKFLVVPDDVKVINVPADINVIKQSSNNVYLASSSAMDLVCTIGAVGHLHFTGTKREEWYVEDAAKAMDAGELIYVGKYNSPDYELLLGNNCSLAIENTMIYHNPEVKEKLEELGITVMVERSSYEAEPMGRLEWIKVYGILFGKEQEAIDYYNSVVSSMDELAKQENTGKTVAYFYITTNNTANVRKSKDYVAKLIEIAGGKYIFENLGVDDDNALSTVNMQLEEFYAGAIDADILIYNSTIAGTLDSLDSLLKLCPMLADFKAVKEGNVYCTNNNFFQKTCSMGDFTKELNKILNGTAEDEMVFLYKLK